MTEKRQTSQGYIIRILQHFATKLRNITNFVMLFQAVMKFLSRLVWIKILVIRGKVNWFDYHTQQVTLKKYKTFSVLIYSYINTSGNWKNEKLCGNTTPEGRSVFTQFRVFQFSRVLI